MGYKYFEDMGDGFLCPNESLMVSTWDGDLVTVSGIRIDKREGEYTVFAGPDDDVIVDLLEVADLDEWWESLTVRSYRVLGE